MFIDVTKLSGLEGRRDGQVYWHNFFAKMISNKVILDVGSGFCKIKERLEINGNKITTQDLGLDLPVDISKDISEIESESFEIVTVFDVIEHVIDSKDFVAHLYRICTEGVILTTPNLTTYKNLNVYHYREFLPREFIDICDFFSKKGRYFVCFDPSLLDFKELTRVDFMNTTAANLAIWMMKC